MGVKTMKKLLLISLLVMVLAFSFVSADGDLTVTIDSDSKSGEVGETLDFTLTLSNTGIDTIDTISITSTDLTNGAETISAPTVGSVTALENGVDQTVTFSVVLPSTLNGIYSGTVTATDDANAANTQAIPYSVTVNAKDSYTVNPESLSYDLFAGDSDSQTLTVTNDGSNTLTDWTISFTSDDGDLNKIEDGDNDEITISYSSLETSLAPGSSMTITVTADAEDDVDAGSDYMGDISLSATGSATISKTLLLDVDVTPDICEEGKQGSDFHINIEQPDSGDNFHPGETVTVEVEVENTANEDLDVVIEITLFNEDEGNKEEVVKVDGEVQEDETETFQIEIDLPTDLDEDDTYYLYVQVHEDSNEDDSCDYEKVKIDIEREDEDVQITEVSISPETGLECGEEYRVSVYVESLGKDDIKDVYVELLDGDLDVSESTTNFDLGDYNDNDNENKLSFDLTVPEDLAEGSYYLEAIAYDDNGNMLDNELLLVELNACSFEAVDTEEVDLTLTIDDNYDVTGNELTISMVIENVGLFTTGINVGIEEVTWATLDSTEYLDTLNPEDSIHAYLYLTLDETTKGEHDLKVIVTDDNDTEYSKIISVDFGEEAVVEEDEFFSKISGWFTAKAGSSGGFWIIADIILVILALIFIRMLFSKK